ncbi:MAG: MFS transporter [Alphaproteobacteria bacterium]|nr:MFS transporter [Alphaproteobacteria bacterium]
MAEPDVAEPPSTGIEPLAPGYRRYALTILLILYTLNFLDRQIVNILTVPIQAELQLEPWQIGAVTGLGFAILYTFLGIPIARYAERGNRPGIISAAVAIWSVFTIACGFAQSFLHLLLARVGVGFGEAGCTPPAHSLITDYTPKEKRASALAYYHLGTPIGSLIGTICGGFIADQWGWRAAFYLAGAPGLVFALVTLFTLVEPRRRLKAVMTARQTSGPSLRDAITELRGKRTFWLLVGGASVLAFNGYGATAFSALFFKNAHGDELATIAAEWGMQPLTFYALSAGITAGIAGIAGVWIGGALSDYFGKRDVRGQMTLPAVAGLISIPAYAAALFAPSYWLALALFTVPTLLSQIWYGPVYGNVQGLVHPRTRATAAAVLLFIVNLIGLGLGPLLVGLLAGHLASLAGWTLADGYRWSLLTFGLLGFLTAAFFWAARTTIRQDLVS